MSDFNIQKITDKLFRPQQGNTTSFVAMNKNKDIEDIHKTYNANPDGATGQVMLSNGQPNSVMS